MEAITIVLVVFWLVYIMLLLGDIWLNGSTVSGLIEKLGYLIWLPLLLVLLFWWTLSSAMYYEMIDLLLPTLTSF
jgi:hypothetical protein